MIGGVEVVLGLVTMALVATRAHGDLGFSWATMASSAPVLLALCFAVPWAAPALALGFVLARVHPLLALSAPVAVLPLEGPGALAVAASWMLAGAAPAWAGLAAAVLAGVFDPVLGVGAIASGMVGLALSRHPGNAAIARLHVRAAPWTLPAPALALFALAVLGRGGTHEWTILRFALLAALLGGWLAFVTFGLGLRFLATNGLAGAWLAASLTCVLLVALTVARGTLHDGFGPLALLLVPLALAAAPSMQRLPAWAAAVPIAVPLVCLF